MLALVLAAVLAQAPGHAAHQHADHARHGARQAEVAGRGAAVMPFDLNRATHRFEPAATGGVQSVRSRDGDVRQIALVRDHLRQEQARFAKGDFRSPAAIHGVDMPGLAALQAGAAKIRVSYQELSDGAALVFATSDPALVAAVHTWFAAQTSDHGAHAEH